MSLVITPLNCDDVPAVKRLLIAGLTERWGVYEPKYNLDIEGLSSRSSDSLTLVARSAGIVVGTGSLRIVGARRARVVRMSTARERRRHGVAAAILQRLLDHARGSGVNEVVVETTSSWESAIAFYTKHGFIRTHEQDGETHLVLRLR